MTHLVVDTVTCDGHGLCADILPEVVDLDEWGYPVVTGPVPRRLRRAAAAAVTACPALALRLTNPSPTPARNAIAAEPAPRRP
ncbi:ferredoxin [Pseudonocardia sp.]|uniref:ferredoxin n=1 Tax=Pseudonocardia sp. TaxID=60912 RepID=UPI003D0D473D